MTITVAFRTDASSTIGSGHVFRCLTLADALKAKGANCHFICHNYPGHLLDFIRHRGQELIHNDRSIKMHLALGLTQKNPQAEQYFDSKNYHQIFAFSKLSQDWMQSNSK